MAIQTAMTNGVQDSNTCPVPIRQALHDAADRFPWLAQYPEAQAAFLRGDMTEATAALKQREYDEWLERQAASRKQLDFEFCLRLGKRHQACTLDAFVPLDDEQRSAKAIVTRFVDAYENHAEKGEGLLPFGPPGSGKTHLAIAAARAVTQRYGARVKFVAGSQIFADVRAAIDGNGLTEADLLRELTRPDVLLIDDPLPPLVLGAGKTAGALTDFQAQWIYRVLEARWSACKATWGTMNVSSRDELSDRLGGASADRLLHGATVVRLNTATHRKPLNAI